MSVHWLHEKLLSGPWGRGCDKSLSFCRRLVVFPIVTLEARSGPLYRLEAVERVEWSVSRTSSLGFANPRVAKITDETEDPD